MTTSDNHTCRNRRLQSLRWWLREDSATLARVVRHARTSIHLQRQLQALLPHDLAGHWRLAKLDGQVLHLVTENPLWATQLRYQRTVLLHGAEAILGQRPQRFQVRIEPTRMTRLPHAPAQLSMQAAECLRHGAECMDQGPLREALLRLASRSRDT